MNGFGERPVIGLDATVYAGLLALARYLFRLGHRIAHPKEHP